MSGRRCGDLGEALQAKQRLQLDLACGPRCRAARPYPPLGRAPRLAPSKGRGNRSKLPTQDRRRLSRYMRRWLVERFFAWIQWQRRILIRWEYHAHNFLGFVQLACLIVSAIIMPGSACGQLLNGVELLANHQPNGSYIRRA